MAAEVQAVGQEEGPAELEEMTVVSMEEHSVAVVAPPAVVPTALVVPVAMAVDFWAPYQDRLVGELVAWEVSSVARPVAYSGSYMRRV